MDGFAGGMIKFYKSPNNRHIFLILAIRDPYVSNLGNGSPFREQSKPDVLAQEYTVK